MTTVRAYERNLMREAFVHEYIKCGNATEAAKRAGYSGSRSSLNATGCRLKKELAKEIERAQKARGERLNLEDDYELKKAIQIMDMCMSLKKVKGISGDLKDEEGNYVLQFDSRGANSALTTICKLRGKFVEKIQIGMADSIFEELERIDEPVEDNNDATVERGSESEAPQTCEKVEE